ncbi:FIST C-terminal domain-containing protein [Treponema sp. OttesenSCG-928-L16]|nr:FIST C-terminal domain-containing protein [Treponema sp. OttesenSCG-928-L16]
MFRSFSAYTNEVDDVDRAVSEILEQLDLDGKLLKNTIGILSCFTDYLGSGVAEALQERLPFDIIGNTTIANASSGEIGETMLCLLVITSDSLDFTAGISDPVLEEDPGLVRRAYEKASAGKSASPAFILSFAPLLFNVSGDFFVEAMDQASGGLPNFGTLAVDHNADYHESYVILNGKAWRDRYAFLLVYGDIKPDFYLGTISDEKVFQEKGAITASQGNQLQSVNGKSVTDFLLSLGLAQNEDGSIAGINSFPIIVDYNDGTEPAVRAMFALTPDGSAVCGGRVPVGAKITIGRFDPQEIIATSSGALDRALQKRGYSVILMYSCVGRYFTLDLNQLAELEMTVSRMKGRNTSYMLSYSGGEICPVYNKDGSLTNRSHNNTFVICAF